MFYVLMQKLKVMHSQLIIARLYIAPGKREVCKRGGYQGSIFLISTWKYMLLVLIRSPLLKCFWWAPQHMFVCRNKKKYQGPVVQSVISLTSSLRVISLTVLADSIFNILKFFAEKMWVAFALQKLLTFFQQKISAYLRITRCKF